MKTNPLLLIPACALFALCSGFASEEPREDVPVSSDAGKTLTVSTRPASPTPEYAKSAPQQETLAASTQVTEEAKKSIGAQIREAEYWFTVRMADNHVGDGIAAPNRGQQMNVHFDRQGLTLTPWTKADEADWSFKVPTATTAAAPAADKARARYGEGEWFDNSARGVEHGLTLDRLASDPGRPLVFTFPVRTELHGQAGNDNQILFKDAAGSTQLRYEQLDALDANGLSIPAELAWNEQTREITWTIAHQGHAYPLTIDPLITRAAGKIVASDGAASDLFGNSVSLSGDTLAVGANSDDIGANGGQGSVYLFSRNQAGAGGWGEVKKLTASDGAASDFFGNSVSLSGGSLAVGAYSDDFSANPDQGSVYVFSRNQGGANGWGEVKKVIASDGAGGDRFGYSVSLSGDTLAVGASDDNIGANAKQGSVTLFARNQGGTNQWGELNKLTASDGAQQDGFGRSVSLSGDTLAVGAFYTVAKATLLHGSAYLFSRNQGGANQWGEVRKLTASDGAEGDDFGNAVSLAGDTLAVGAIQDNVGGNNRQGSVTLFSRNQGGVNQWGEVRKLTASDGTALDYFGSSVSLSGDSLVVGAWGDGIGGTFGQGSVYLLSRNQGGANQWGEVGKLAASDAAADDYFGYSVSLSGNTLAVGAPLDDIGADGFQGSLTLFDLTQSQWTRADVASPPAAPAITVEKFSAAMAATPDTLVVGAPDSDVVALGGANVGRAYVFTAPQGTVTPDWTLEAALQPTLVEAGSRFGASVAILPGYIAVGAPGDDGDRGQAHLFARNQGGAGNWGEIKRLQGMAAGHRFAAAVALSADGWWAIGAPGAPAGGQVTLHERNTGGDEQWGQARTVTYSSPYSPDLPEAAEFGAALAMEESRLLIGAPGGTGRVQLFPVSLLLPNSGFAFVHEKDSGALSAWGPVARLNEANFSGAGSADGRFGTSVVLSGEYAAATQPGRGNTVVFHRYDLPLPGAGQWDLIQRFEGTRAIALSESILAVSRTSEAAVETYRRDPAAAFTWKSISLIRNNDVTAATGYGFSLALAGECLFAGAPEANVGQGQLHVYGRQQQDFREITQRLASDGAADDAFGIGVALSGDTLAVGADADDVGANNNQGSVYLFSRNRSGANQWGELQILRDSTGTAGDSFGHSISLSGDTLAIGAHADSTGGIARGSVVLFSRDATNQWLRLKRIIPAVSSAYGYFGKSVSLSGDTLAVGADRDEIDSRSNQGSVTLFSRNRGGAGQWGEVVKLIASDGAAGDQFGQSISLQGDTLAVGTPYSDPNLSRDQGSVYVFHRNQGSANLWGEVTKLTASDGDADDYFGSAVSLSGDTLAAGALGSNSGQGSAYVFSRNQGGANVWGELRKLTASDGLGGDYFGSAVSLSGDTLAVGSELDEIAGTSRQGSVTLFARNQGGANQWGELKKLFATDGSVDDNFGQSVSLSGDTLAVGADYDDNGANGDQGSVYLFQIDRSLFDEWILEQFGAVSVNNPGLEATIWGDLADPDGDGLKNIAEAYFGLNPQIPDAPQPVTFSAEDTLFIYRWQRALEHRGIQAMPTWSPDLLTWYRSGSGPAGNTRSIGLINRGLLFAPNHETMEATLPVTGSPKSFLRLEFSR